MSVRFGVDNNNISLYCLYKFILFMSLKKNSTEFDLTHPMCQKESEHLHVRYKKVKYYNTKYPVPQF